MLQSPNPVVPKKASYQPIRLAHHAPGAKEVIVTGDFCGWTREGIRLQSTGNGLWETTLQLAPGDYQYRLLVDGRWQDHPGAKQRVPNPYGSQNCVLAVPPTAAGR